MNSEQPIFEARPLKLGAGYYVLVTYHDGRTEQINEFGSEDEATIWIQEHSQDWLSN